MTCDERRADLIAYLDGELAAAARAELETHLRSCANCQAALAAERRLSGALGSLEAIHPPGDFEARFWARIARESAAPAGWRERLFSRRFLLALGGAAAAALAAVVALRIRDAELNDAVDLQIVANPDDLEMLEDPDLELFAIMDELEQRNGDSG